MSKEREALIRRLQGWAHRLADEEADMVNEAIEALSAPPLSAELPETFVQVLRKHASDSTFEAVMKELGHQTERSGTFPDAAGEGRD